MPKLKGVDANEIGMPHVEALFHVEPGYLDAAYEEMLSRYGSVDAYIRDGLGITDFQLKQVRDRLLE
jgi:protein-tyrosine phosphatase